jgi:hypothetical protein
MTKASLTAFLTAGLILPPLVVGLPLQSGAQQSSAQETSVKGAATQGVTGQGATTEGAAAHEHCTCRCMAQQTQSGEQHCDMAMRGDMATHCDMMTHDDTVKRGDQAMGFSQGKTTHHFYLAKDGGVIQVAVNDAKDAASREQIRQHLTHIAHLFADGNFDAPMFIHGTTPPGVPTMTRLHEQIRYEFQETLVGGRVRITTANAQALDAIHAFLLFQIVDHQTGDSGAVTDVADKK